MRAAAIFDLDGTLLPGTSTERLFLARAVREHALHPARLAWGATLSVASWLRHQTATPFERKAYLAQQNSASFEALGVTCVHADVLPRLRPDLVRALETHRQRGEALVLLSGTLDFLGTELARALGIEFAVVAGLERSGGRFTGWVVPPHPHGGGKLTALVALAAREQLDLAKSTAYANHASDLAHLERVGFPQAVTPDRALRVAAERHGWPVWEATDESHRTRPAG